MALNHVAKQSGFFKIGSSVFNSQFLSHGNLHVVDVAAVPNGLKNPVGKAEDQKILNRFLAQIMVDPVNILLAKCARDHTVKLPGAGQVASKRFFENDSCPVLFRVLGLRKAGAAKMLHDNRKKTGRRSQIKKPIARRAIVAVKLIEKLD